MTKFKRQQPAQAAENQQPTAQQVFVNVPIPLEEWNDLRKQIDLIHEEIKATRKERDDEMITIGEACKIWKVSIPTFHRWRNEGKITFPLVKNGKSVRMKRRDVLYFNEHGINE